MATTWSTQALALMRIPEWSTPSIYCCGSAQTNTGAANVANAGGAVGGANIPASQIRGRRLQQTGTGTRSGYTQGQGQGQAQAQAQAQDQGQSQGQGQGQQQVPSTSSGGGELLRYEAAQAVWRHCDST